MKKTILSLLLLTALRLSGAEGDTVFTQKDADGRNEYVTLPKPSEDGLLAFDFSEGDYQWLPFGDLDMTPADILSDLLTVDGTGSGIDADFLDGVSLAGLVQTGDFSPTEALAASALQPGDPIPVEDLEAGSALQVPKVAIDGSAVGWGEPGQERGDGVYGDIDTGGKGATVRNLPSGPIVHLWIYRDSVYRVKLLEAATFQIHAATPGARVSLMVEQGGGGSVTSWGSIRFGSAGEPTLGSGLGDYLALDIVVAPAGRTICRYAESYDDPITSRGDLLYLLDPNVESTLTESGGALTAITGAAGTGAAASMGGTATLVRDAVNGRNALRFNGTSNRLSTSGANLIGAVGARYPLTMYFVLKSITHTDQDRYFDASAEDMRVFQRSTTPAIGYFNGAATVQANPPVADGNWFIVAVCFNGLNNGTEFLHYGGNAEQTGLTFGTREGVNRDISLGGSIGGHSFANCEVAALAIYENQDDADEQDAIITELQRKYTNSDLGTDDVVQLPPNRIVGHRGGSEATHPENTRPCWDEAYRYGIRSMECDVQKSSDGVLFIMHDTGTNGLIRTTNVESVFPSRQTDDPTSFTWAELQTLDAGSWKNAAFEGTKIPSIEEFLRYCMARGVTPVLDFYGFLSADVIALCEEIGFPLRKLQIHVGLGYTSVWQAFAGRVGFLGMYMTGSHITNPETVTDEQLETMAGYGIDGAIFLGSLSGDTFNAGDFDRWYAKGILPFYYLADSEATADAAVASGLYYFWTGNAAALYGSYLP